MNQPQRNPNNLKALGIIAGNGVYPFAMAKSARAAGVERRGFHDRGITPAIGDNWYCCAHIGPLHSEVPRAQIPDRPLHRRSRRAGGGADRVRGTGGGLDRQVRGTRRLVLLRCGRRQLHLGERQGDLSRQRSPRRVLPVEELLPLIDDFLHRHWSRPDAGEQQILKL